MKDSTKNASQNKSVSTGNKKAIPENKDNMDSREGEEQLEKPGFSTHNKKEVESEKKSVGKTSK